MWLKIMVSTRTVSLLAEDKPVSFRDSNSLSKEVATIIKIVICDDIKEQNKDFMYAMNLQIFLYASICRPVEVNEQCKYYQ
jgi:hypothetical protein